MRRASLSATPVLPSITASTAWEDIRLADVGDHLAHVLHADLPAVGVEGQLSEFGVYEAGLPAYGVGERGGGAGIQVYAELARARRYPAGHIAVSRQRELGDLGYGRQLSEHGVVARQRAVEEGEAGGGRHIRELVGEFGPSA